MGRVFVVELEGPVYGCKECHTDLARPTDIITWEHYGMHGKLYVFSKLFNIFLVASTVPHFSDVFCVFCTTLIGSYYINAHFGPSYRVFRSKLRGPQGSNDEV